MPDDEIAGLSVVVSAELQQAMKALQGMSRQFEATAQVAQESIDSQQEGFEDVERNLKSDSEAHKKHSLSIQEGLKKGGMAWAAMGAAVTGAMYGIIRASSYGELYMTRFSSIMRQAADTLMVRYGLTGALDDALNAFQRLVSGTRGVGGTFQDMIHWWLKASGVLKVITFLMGVGLVAGLAKAGTALAALVGWIPLVIAGLGAVTVYLLDYIFRSEQMVRSTSDLSRSWNKFKESIGDGRYLKAAKDVISEFIGWIFSAEQWIPTEGPLVEFFNFIKTNIARAGTGVVEGIRDHLRIHPGELTADFVTNINKGIKWLDTAIKINYPGLFNWAAVFVDQIREWGVKKWEELLDWTKEVNIWDFIKWATKSGWDLLTWVGKTLWDFIVWAAKSGWDLITWVGSTLWDVLVWAAKNGWDLITWAGGTLWDFIIWTPKAWEDLIDWSTDFWDALVTAGGLILKGWSDLVDWTVGGFWDTLDAAGGVVQTAWEGLVDWTTSTFWDNVTPGESPATWSDVGWEDASWEDWFNGFWDNGWVDWSQSGWFDGGGWSLSGWMDSAAIGGHVQRTGNVVVHEGEDIVRLKALLKGIREGSTSQNITIAPSVTVNLPAGTPNARSIANEVSKILAADIRRLVKT